MSGNVESFGGWVKASVAMVNRVVAKKDTRGGSKFNLMTIVRTEIRKTLASENTKKGVIRFPFKNMFIRRFVGGDTRGKTVN
ncbi:hypothetical protein HanIR_Chr02g0067661 [Helianthus annuus]|nr:hypothetical protein HanIR_Chr02g0067661 [Helianthus annuus]